MVKIAYSYLRYSSLPQGLGDSIRRQIEGSERCAKRNGWVLDDSLRLHDHGVSAFRGANSTNGRLGAFLDAIKRGRVRPGAVLVCESLDRLSRDEIDEAYDLFRSILRAGVEIHTLTPEDHFDRKTLNDPIRLIIVISIMARGHEESQIKSERVGAAWANKRKKLLAGEKIRLTRKIPAWLDKETWEPIPEKVAVIKRIFGWVLEGKGLHYILRTLTAEKVRPLGRAKKWGLGSLYMLLHNRCLLGEYEVCEGSHKTGRKKVSVVKGYYPPVLSEDTFYRASQALSSRFNMKGRTGERVSNLFQGLIKSSEDGEPCVLCNKRTNRYIVSRAATRGEADYLSFPYPHFERCLLAFYLGLNAKDVLPPDPERESVTQERENTEKRIAHLERQIKKINAKVEAGADVDSVWDLLSGLKDQRKAAQDRAEELRTQEFRTGEAHNLTEFQNILWTLDETPEEGLFDLRSRIRAAIRELVQEIRVSIIKVSKHERLLTGEIVFHTGVTQPITLWSRCKECYIIAEYITIPKPFTGVGFNGILTTLPDRLRGYLNERGKKGRAKAGAGGAKAARANRAEGPTRKEPRTK